MQKIQTSPFEWKAFRVTCMSEVFTTKEKQERRLLIAYVAPFAVYMGLLALSQLMPLLPFGEGEWWREESAFWVYPLQTIAVGALLWYFRGLYRVRMFRKPWFSLGIGGVVLVLWISPQLFFAAEPRTDGFQPSKLADDPFWMGFQYAFRFLRLVVVVPIMEEIFWRGFLVRYLIHTKFDTVAVGRFTPMAFWTTVVLFGMAHAGPDLPAALLTGVLYNFVLMRTRSISDCILAHALTNLLLGIYIVTTKQWGFW